MKEAEPSLLARVKKPGALLIMEALQHRSISKKVIASELNTMFRKRNELVHGSPRHLAFRDQLDAFLSREELVRYIHYALQYMRRADFALREFIPEVGARFTWHNNFNQWQRLGNSDQAIKKLEQAIEKRIADDPDHLSDFRKAQRAWRVWRKRESLFQSGDWGYGSEWLASRAPPCALR